MKTMLGCCAIDRSGSWPTKVSLKERGHDIEKLNARLLEVIGEGL